MKVSLIFILSLISIKVSALDKGIINQISDINRQEYGFTAYKCARNLVVPFQMKSSNSLELNECAFELCGDSRKVKSAYLTNQNFSQFVSPQLLAKVNSLDDAIKKVLQVSKARNLKELDKISSKFKDIDSYEFKQFSDTFLEEFNNLIFLKYVKIKTDTSRPINERISFELNPNNPAPKELIPALNDYIQASKNSYDNNYEYIIENKILSKDEIISKFKNDFEKIKKVEFEKNIEITDFQKNQIKKKREEVEKRLSENDISDESIKAISLELFNLKSQFADLDVQNKDLNPKPICRTNNCLISFRNYFKSLKMDALIDKTKKDLENPDIANQSINRCKASFVSNFLNKSNQIKANEVFKEARNAIIKNVLPRFSSHSRKILNEYLLKKLKVKNFNLVRMEDANVDKEINSFKKAALAFSEEENNLMSNDYVEDYLRNGVLLNEHFSTFDPFSNNESPCRSDLQATVWDAFLPVSTLLPMLKNSKEDKAAIKILGKDDAVFISNFSCQHQDIGKMTIAHEIGHALNSVFASQKLSEESAKKYKLLRQCSTDNYADAPLERKFTSQEGDTVYTEEDSADVFSFMSYPNEKSFFACSLLKPDLNGTGYTELSLYEEGEDAHSTPLARLINEAIHKNIELPVSCQRLLKSNDSVRLKKCF